jgi:aromatic-L-amino-acid decarboxylase
LYDRLADDVRFEVCTHSLSITTFRFVPASLRGVPRSAAVEAKLNEINRALQSRLETSGELFVSNAVIEGTYVLRACIVNFRTSPRDIEEIPDIVARHGEAVWAEATGS